MTETMTQMFKVNDEQIKKLSAEEKAVLMQNASDFLTKIREEEERERKNTFKEYAVTYFGMSANQAKKRVKFAEDVFEFFGVKDDAKVEALKRCLMSDEVKKAANDFAMKKSREKNGQSSNPVPSSANVSSSPMQDVMQKNPPR